MTLQSTITNKSSKVEERQKILELDSDQTKQLNVQMEEFKKIEKLKISSSHDSEVIKYKRDVAVQFSYMKPERKSFILFPINRTSNFILSF